MCIGRPPPDAARAELDRNDYDALWARFDERFGLRVGVDPSAWPAIREPTPSITFDLSVIPDGPTRGAAYDAINAEALRASSGPCLTGTSFTSSTGSTPPIGSSQPIRR